MELFTAGDESQMEVIKQWIDESDVYLLILGGRYGSIEPKTGKSYTHLEYEYAISKGIPLFACVIKEETINARVKTEGKDILELENPQKFRVFREEVLTRMSKFWDDSKDIKITITETLSQLARRENLVGWIRPSTQSDLPALADEIARLSKENAVLRSQLESSAHGEDFNGLSFLEMKNLLVELDLLDFLIQERPRLTMGIFSPSDLFSYKEGPPWRYSQLLARGLITSRGGNIFLSSNGLRFLNKLEYSKRFPAKDLPPRPSDPTAPNPV